MSPLVHEIKSLKPDALVLIEDESFVLNYRTYDNSFAKSYKSVSYSLISRASAAINSLTGAIVMLKAALVEYSHVRRHHRHKIKKQGLKRPNTSMSVPPLALYKWAIKHKRNRKPQKHKRDQICIVPF